MKKYKSYIIGLWLFCMASVALFSACNKDKEEEEEVVNNTYKPVKLTPVSGLRIAWDYSSLKQLAAKGASPKMIRNSNQLVAVYASDNNVYMTSSIDEGLTWSNVVTLFSKSSHTGKNGNDDITYNQLMVQPTIIRLQDGSMVAACAVRYQYTLSGTTTEFSAAIKVRRINDDLSLEPVTEVYANVGAENPSFLQLPTGQLQLYFVNSATSQSIRMLNSTEMSTDINEQHVVVVESNDDGQTWSSSIKNFGPDGVNRSWTGARTVASRANKNNIWPAPAVVGEEIVVALADNLTMTYKPYIVRSPLSANWTSAVKGDTPDREYALYEILPDKYFMSLPDLLVLSTGETLLSYETDEGRTTGFEVMEVAIGNRNAYNFKYRTRPFPFGVSERSVSNSMMLFDNNTIVALTTSNHGLASNNVAPWYIKGHLLNDLTISSGQIMNYPIFVGGQTEAQINAGLGIDANTLYVGVKAKDSTPVTAESGTQKGDGVYLYIDAPNLSLLDVDAGISKFWVSLTGEVSRWDGKEGKWVAAPIDGVAITTNALADGYTLDIAIPRSKLTNFNNQNIRFGIGFTNYTDANTGVTELLSLCQDLRSSTWLGVTFSN